MSELSNQEKETAVNYSSARAALREAFMMSREEKETAGVICGGRAVFYYPPGSKTGWTLKRILVVSLLGHMAWSLIIGAVVNTAMLFI